VLTPGDIGLVTPGAVLDTIQVPMLTEAAAQTLAGWTQLDLFLDRRESLKLTIGAPLVLVAERMLGGVARRLNPGRQGFRHRHGHGAGGSDGVLLPRGRCQGRRPVPTSDRGAARRGSPAYPGRGSPSLHGRVFTTTADLAALAGWVSHDSGRYATAQRYWSYGIYAAGEAGRRDRGVEIVTRMSHQMI
jgi:hypothetical protein